MNPLQSPDWLAQLAPPHAPPPPGWWPPAPGWWVLAAVLLAAVAAAWFGWMRPSRRLRRRALRELSDLEKSHQDSAQFARGLQDLLRRYAVARYGRDAVARLAGTAWIDFLVAHGGAELAGNTGAALLHAAYAGAATNERTRWAAGARAFIKARK